MKYKFLPHTADIKFRAYGKTLNEVFENSALALNSAFYEGKVKALEKKKIKVKGRDLESLMFRFLEELLFLYETENFLTSKIKVKVSKDNKLLEAETFGEKPKSPKGRGDIKAVTYNDMFVKKIKDKWISQVVLDV